MITYKSFIKARYSFGGATEFVPGFVITAEDIADLVESHGFIDLVASDDPFSQTAVNSILENSLDVKFDNKVEKIFKELGKGVFIFNGNVVENILSYREFYSQVIKFISEIISSNTEYLLEIRKVINYEVHGFCRRDRTNNLFVIESEYGAMDYNTQYTDTYFISPNGELVDYYTQNQQTIKVVEGAAYKYLKLPETFSTRNKLNKTKIEELTSIFSRNKGLNNFSYGYKSGKLYLEELNLKEKLPIPQILEDEERTEEQADNIQLAAEVYALMDISKTEEKKVQKNRSFYFDILKTSNVFSNLPLITGAKRFLQIKDFDFDVNNLSVVNSRFGLELEKYLDNKQIDHLVYSDLQYSSEKFATILALAQRHGLIGEFITPSISIPDQSLEVREFYGNLDQKTLKLNLQITAPSVLGYVKKFGIPVTYNIDRLMFNLFEGENKEEVNDYLDLDTDYSLIVSRSNLKLLEKKVVDGAGFVIIK